MSPWINHVWVEPEIFPSTDARVQGLKCIRAHALVRHGCGWFTIARRGQLTAGCRCGARVWLSEADVWATSDVPEKLRGLVPFYRGGGMRTACPVGDIDARPFKGSVSQRSFRAHRVKEQQAPRSSRGEEAGRPAT